MNGLVILSLLLLIIPVQLFFDYITSNAETGSNNQDVLTSLTSALQRIEETALYYTTFDHFKELFVVPYHPKKKFVKKVIKDPETIKDVLSRMMESQTDNGEPSNENDDPDDDDRPLKYVQKKIRSPTDKSKVKQTSSSTSAASEVEKYNEDFVYFAKSAVPRLERPWYLKFKVGEIVRHTHDGYRGVVVGWDIKCKVPDWWLEKHGYYVDQIKEDMIRSPHYLVLVSATDEAKSSLYYLPQDHLMLDTEVVIVAEQIDQYFTHYSSSTGKYVPKEWLRKRYPKDT